MVCGHVRTVRTTCDAAVVLYNFSNHPMCVWCFPGVSSAKRQGAVPGLRSLSALAQQETHQGLLHSCFCWQLETRDTAAPAGKKKRPHMFSSWFQNLLQIPVQLKTFGSIVTSFSSGCWFGPPEAQHAGDGFQEQLERWRHEGCGELHQLYPVRTFSPLKSEPTELNQTFPSDCFCVQHHFLHFSDAFDLQFGVVILRLQDGLDISHIQGQGTGT